MLDKIYAWRYTVSMEVEHGEPQRPPKGDTMNTGQFERLDWTTWQPEPYETTEMVISVIAEKISGDTVDAVDAINSLLEAASWRWCDTAAIVDHTGQYHPFASCHTWLDTVVAAFKLLQQWRARGWLKS